MAGRRIIPIGDKAVLRGKLVAAMGEVLARDGYLAVTPDKVARAAGVPRSVLFHLFHGLEGLAEAFAQSEPHWPSLAELAGGDLVAFQALPLAGQMATVYRGYGSALRRRPQTVQILSWEARQRTPLTKILESVRVRRSLEIFELGAADFPEDVDMSAVVAVAAAAMLHLSVRTVTCSHFGGLDLDLDLGWRRVADTLQLMFERTLGLR
ncbi:MAG: TetR family transcriptional regulator [Thermodesulfobacteriota bacterium]